MDDKWEPPLIERLADIIYAQAIPGWDMGDAFALAEELLAEIGKTHVLVEFGSAYPGVTAREGDQIRAVHRGRGFVLMEWSGSHPAPDTL
jgi:hypothetical protein